MWTALSLTPTTPPRGLAAISILFWHYHNFIEVERSAQPLYIIFKPFYEYGELAVLCFWIISGFVFAHVYIKHRGTGKEFFINRFARLYPLHFLTLLVVAGLQILSLHQTGMYQIYQYNDLYHFVLNLLFIPHWGFQEGRSFNAPIWSVSVELLIYLIFWFVLPFIVKRGLFVTISLVPIFLTMFFVGLPGTAFWKCGAFFFTGSSLFILHSMLQRQKFMLFIAISSFFTLSLAIHNLQIYRADIFSQLLKNKLYDQ